MTIDARGNNHRPEGVVGAGRFAPKIPTAPASSLTVPAGVACSSCGAVPATHRRGDIPRGHRAPDEAQYCDRCAAVAAADGVTVERAPRPQEDGEELTWLVEGDDHEFVTVLATDEDTALEGASEMFTERYDEEYSADLLSVVAGFREDDDDPFGELQWVPGTGASENDAYGLLEDADV